MMWYPCNASGLSKNVTDGLDPKVPNRFKKEKRKEKVCFDPNNWLLGSHALIKNLSRRGVRDMDRY